MMPGLLKGTGADAGLSPYRPYISGESRMSPTAVVMPIIIDAVIPLAVVFFQNKIIMIAGRLAEAATAKARPTRNDTFIP